ncbi:DUF397 domain-containing protein [Streptomyces sp. NPDC086554]|uniref:DUF397 domain-containing protein n=1 Tax=Streptomyces sp. NPDC086554 TaxID=3154864 RepID=UPI003447E9EA
MTAAPVWQKSSFSGNEDAPNCVELATTTGGILLRESDAPGTELSASPAQLAALIRSVKSRAEGRTQDL